MSVVLFRNSDDDARCDTSFRSNSVSKRVHVYVVIKSSNYEMARCVDPVSKSDEARVTLIMNFESLDVFSSLVTCNKAKGL